jgi:parallel beta-helix repeat protein
MPYSLVKNSEANLQRCTVRIERGGQLNASGSGFFVAPGIVLTCRHVLGSAAINAPVTLSWGGMQYSAKARNTKDSAFEDLDLVLLEIDDTALIGTHPCVRIGGDSRVGDPCYIFGYSDLRPEGDPAEVRVEGFTGNGNPHLKLSSGQVRPGMSGSPLLNLRTGEVCGVVSITRDRASNLGGLAVPIDVITQDPSILPFQRQFHLDLEIGLDSYATATSLTIVNAGESLAVALGSTPVDGLVVLRPGTYSEPIEVNKSIRVMGWGTRDSVVVVPKAHKLHNVGLLWEAPRGTLSNVTIRGGTDKTSAAVYIQGGLVLADCDIDLQQASSGLTITSEELCRVRRCRVFNGNIGIAAGLNAKPEIDACELFELRTGFFAVDGAAPILQSCQVRNNIDVGATFRNGAHGVIRDCEVLNNGNIGIEIRDGSDPKVVDNRIHENLQGIRVGSRGAGIVSNNEIARNRLSGIHIVQDATPTVRGNYIHGNSECGVSIQDESTPLIDDNRMQKNGLHGIAFTNCARGRVTNNRCYQNKQGGIIVRESATPTIVGNDLYANGMSGLFLEGGEQTLVENNRMHDNTDAGIKATNHGRGRANRNDIYRNGLSGVIVLFEACPTLEDNLIHDNLEHGVFLNDCGRAQLLRNNIYENVRCGISMFAQSIIKGENNIIRKNGFVGLYIDNSDASFFFRNTIEGNDKGDFGGPNDVLKEK